MPGRLFSALLLTIAIGGLATPSAAQERTRIRIALPAFGAQVVLDTIGEVRTVNAPPMKVFTAASLVLRNLRIPIDISDSLMGMVGAAKLVRNRNLGGQALSRYLECGSGMTGPRADSHRIMMPLLVLIDPGPDSTSKVRIALVGSAQDNAGNSTQPVQCGSTGIFEGELRKAIDQQIAVLK